LFADFDDFTPGFHLVEGLWWNRNNETKSFSRKGKPGIAGVNKSRYPPRYEENFRSPIKKGR